MAIRERKIALDLYQKFPTLDNYKNYKKKPKLRHQNPQNLKKSWLKKLLLFIQSQNLNISNVGVKFFKNKNLIQNSTQNLIQNSTIKPRKANYFSKWNNQQVVPTHVFLWILGELFFASILLWSSWRQRSDQKWPLDSPVILRAVLCSRMDEGYVLPGPRLIQLWNHESSTFKWN